MANFWTKILQAIFQHNANLTESASPPRKSTATPHNAPPTNAYKSEEKAYLLEEIDRIINSAPNSHFLHGITLKKNGYTYWATQVDLLVLGQRHMVSQSDLMNFEMAYEIVKDEFTKTRDTELVVLQLLYHDMMRWQHNGYPLH